LSDVRERAWSDYRQLYAHSIRQTAFNFYGTGELQYVCRGIDRQSGDTGIVNLAMDAPTERLRKLRTREGVETI